MKETAAIRKAAITDAAAISRVFQRSWRKSYSGIVDRDYLQQIRETHWVEFFETGLAGQFTGFAAETEDEIVGAVIIGPSAEGEFPQDAEIYCLYVDPQRQRQKIGSDLLNTALNYLRKQGKKACYLYVFDENEDAMRLYTRYGFETVRTGEQVTLGEKKYPYSIMRRRCVADCKSI